MAEAEEFLTVQALCWEDVTLELRAGRKTSHWIWWIFPQLASLGRSPRAKHFGLADLAEAEAYLAHPDLGPRLVAVAEMLLAQAGTPPATVLGEVDAQKVRSSMTLFEALPGAPEVFSLVLDRMYDGRRCARTSAALSS